MIFLKAIKTAFIASTDYAMFVEALKKETSLATIGRFDEDVIKTEMQLRKELGYRMSNLRLTNDKGGQLLAQHKLLVIQQENDLV